MLFPQTSLKVIYFMALKMIYGEINSEQEHNNLSRSLEAGGGEDDPRVSRSTHNVDLSIQY